MANRARNPAQPTLDVAVIGGGIGGVYTAWRLIGCDAGNSNVLARRVKKGPRVALFEYSNRIGGRLLSQKITGAPHLPIELGGMRFLNAHERVSGLIGHLQLPVKPFPVADPREMSLYYLRGQRFKAASWKDSTFTSPYALESGERGKSPDQLLIEVAQRHQADAASLYNQGFWNLLLKDLSAEAYRLVMDGGGYYTIINNWNAARAIPFLLIDFGPGVEYFALRDGFQELPSRLARQFEDTGGEVRMRHKLCLLERVQRHGEPMIKLTFDTGHPDKFEFRRISKPAVYYARNVVLAMPRRAIELLHPDSFLFDSEQFQTDLRTVLAQPAFKLFAAYRKPWWDKEPLNITSGRSQTDLPLRQCYYWGTEGDQDGADRSNRNSILMASYNDGTAVEFWAGLARSKRIHRTPTKRTLREIQELGSRFSVMQHLKATEVMVFEMQRQLQELHGLRDFPMPYETVYRDWTIDPYGGGWHFWKIHVQAEEVMPRIQHPIADANVYICGEAWSTQQGWVEGALETADNVLQDHFELSAPAWLKERPPAR